MLLGHRRVAVVPEESAACPTGYFRQSEIEYLGVTALGHEDIGGLDVAMHDAFGMRGVQCVGDLDGQASSVSRSNGRPQMRCFRVMPSRNSMAMNGWPSCSPMS